MTAAAHANKLKLKEKLSALGAPPALDEIKGNLGVRGRPGRKRKAEKMTQLNLRVPEELKYRLRILATRDRREMSDIVIVIEAITLYEARYGVAPSLEPTREGWARACAGLFCAPADSPPQRCFASRCASISSSATLWDRRRSERRSSVG